MHTLQHTPKAKSEAAGRECVVYSLAYHHKEACLLTVGSFGPVRVWKTVTWDATAEEDGEETSMS